MFLFSELLEGMTERVLQQRQGPAMRRKNTALSLLKKTSGKDFTDFNQVTLRDLLAYMEYTFPKQDQHKVMDYWDSLVASKQDLILDLHSSNYLDVLPANRSKYTQMERVKLGANLAPRSSEGHAHEGHVTFRNGKYPNTSLYRIISDDVLGNFTNSKNIPYYGTVHSDAKSYNSFKDLKVRSISPKEHFLIESQEYIDSVVRILEDAVDSRRKLFSTKKYRSEELINSLIPGNVQQIDAQALVKGSIFGGNFDNYEGIRKPAENMYDMRIGGGSQYLLNVHQVKKYGITLNELAKGTFSNEVLDNISFDQRMELFKKLGIIKEPTSVSFEGVNSWDEIKEQGVNMHKESTFIPVYIREQKGPGVSDDGACIFVGFHDFDPKNPARNAYWYDSLQRGSHLMDAVDTLEKATTYFFSEGQDEVISNYIAHRWFNLMKEDANYRKTHNINLKDIERRVEEEGTLNFAPFPKEEIIDLTAASTNSQRKFGDVKIHSSLRYFLEPIRMTMAGHDNAGKRKTKKLSTNVFNQEKVYAQRLFESKGANVRLPNGSYIVDEKLYSSGFKIGFAGITANSVFDYFNFVGKLISDPTTRRQSFKERFNK